MLVFKPRLALVYAVVLVIFTVVTNRISISNNIALAAANTPVISTLVVIAK